MILLAGAVALPTQPMAAQDDATEPVPPAEVAREENAEGVQVGGTEIRIRVPGTEVLVRDDPDDPRHVPPPVIYGEELCPATKVAGQFEPAQGVWQDDPTFEDRSGKQITRVSATSWHAELPMVTGRKSLLFGIERAVGGSEPRRNEIFVKGEASGVPVPVFFRFTLAQGGATRTIYESEILGEVPIGGPCGPTPTSFHVVLEARDGIPREFTFEFERDGEYTLTAELMTGPGRPTGIRIDVTGRSVTTDRPSLAFRPIALLSGSLAPDIRERLEAAARSLRVTSALSIPDYFPVTNVPLTTGLFPFKDQSSLLVHVEEGRRMLISEVVERLDWQLQKLAALDLSRELQVGALMGGFDRVVAILSDQDHELLKRWVKGERDDAAWAEEKVVFLNLEKAIDPYTVAHEIAHTLAFLYSSPQMLDECGTDYHNEGQFAANGHQITADGEPGRLRRDRSPHLMGPLSQPTTEFVLVEGQMIVYSEDRRSDIWIEQCTYRHLLEVLSGGVPDPPIVLIQGFLGRGSGGAVGALMPVYEFDAVEDLPADGPGSFAIVLRDAAGAMLARHAWEPIWSVPDLEAERDALAFAFRLRRPDALARIELEGPQGVLDTRDLSASRPEVTIRSPGPGEPVRVDGSTVRVEWSGADADGDPLVYTVLYSSNGGETWLDVAFETPEASVLVPVDPEAPADAHRILVRATDGGRSSDALQTLHPVVGGS
jgi:hypothetical protein